MRIKVLAALAGASMVVAGVSPVQAQGSGGSAVEYVDVGFGFLTTPDGNRYGIQATARHTESSLGDYVMLYVWAYQVVPTPWGYDDWVTLASYFGSSETAPLDSTVNVVADKSASIRGSFVPQYGTIGSALSITAECLPLATSSFVYNVRYRNNDWYGDGNVHQTGNSFGGECTVTLNGAAINLTFNTHNAIVQATRSAGH